MPIARHRAWADCAREVAYSYRAVSVLPAASLRLTQACCGGTTDTLFRGQAMRHRMLSFLPTLRNRRNRPRHERTARRDTTPPTDDAIVVWTAAVSAEGRNDRVGISRLTVEVRQQTPELECPPEEHLDPARAEVMTKELTGQSIGGWTVGDKVGAGKSAVVFRATRGGDEAALKVFDRELIALFGKDIQQQRIDRERSLIGKRHRNLVAIVDGGYEAHFDVMYVAMEYLPYASLDNVIHRLPRERIWPTISQIAEAARFLEQHGLAHRDIKPENIALSPDFEHAVLLDLGVLRPIETDYHSVTDLRQLEFLATLRYTSPEYLMREEEDTPDGWRALTFYQLGAVLHDLIMRRRLFADSEAPFGRLVEAVRHQIPEVEAADVPPSLIYLTRNCLLKNPHRRLEFVKWESFATPSAPGDPASEIAERIRRRSANAAETVAFGTTTLEIDRARILQRAMQEAVARLDGFVRAACQSIEILPPFRIEEVRSSVDDQRLLILNFEPSPAVALPLGLGIAFTIKMIEAREAVLEIAAVARSEPLSPERLAARPELRTLFRGALEESVAASAIRDALLRYVDAAQTMTAHDWLLADAGESR